MSDQDKRAGEELSVALRSAGWTTGFLDRNSHGLLVTFQDRQYTSDVPGIEKRHALGKDWDDAVRKFLGELETRSQISVAQPLGGDV